MIQLSLIDYFWLRQRIPIFFYFFYVYFKKSDNSRLSILVKSLVFFSGLTTIYFTMGYILKIPFEKLISLRWHYSGIIIWTIFFRIYYLIIRKKNYNHITAFALSIIATAGGGWLYEMPFNSKMSFIIDLNTVFLIDGQILCLLLLGYELRKRGFQINFLTCVMFSLYIIFSIMFFFNFWGIVKMFNVLSGSYNLFTWLYRVPACLFLLSLLGGIENKSQ